MARTVIGLFDTYSRAERGIDILERAGIDPEGISVVARADVVKEHLDDDRKKDALRGGGAGALGGAGAGALAGLLTGAAAVTLSGVGAVIAAGTAATVLGAVVAGAGLGATYGGFAGALVGLGLSEEETHLYVEGVRQGNLMVVVELEEGQSRVWKAENGLHQARALEVSTWEGSWSEQELSEAES
jgi:hypothetical protein